jgi:dUTP pyrophosphatase
MVISPRYALEKEIIIPPDDVDIEKCIQQNGIDFTLDRLWKVDNKYPNHISNTDKKFAPRVEIEHDLKHSWTLERNTVYDGMSNFYINLPENTCCLLIGRSSFNRAGVIVHSGLYDAGFKGHIGFMLYSHMTVVVEKSVRVGQVIILKGESASLYNGSYKHELGTVWHQT